MYSINITLANELDPEAEPQAFNIETNSVVEAIDSAKSQAYELDPYGQYTVEGVEVVNE